ncbi:MULTISPECIES: hypothetical protein [unclassified Thermosynechococcus]|uniref:hypothetical protein n=1 Tax=unclassified Thermosynechococcus TaxID=2622553 RepID=UPI0019D87D18|nr:MULTISPECIES: hypothetical protein [unclassified Thermosynechococcus]HIK34918.1 hypothetical protein [Thermosynechococcus sp. M98_K2018_005]HIK47405.1 hypothetical protein [Thermosynechococcus sp. M55_K2018_012]
MKTAVQYETDARTLADALLAQARTCPPPPQMAPLLDRNAPTITAQRLSPRGTPAAIAVKTPPASSPQQ